MARNNQNVSYTPDAFDEPPEGPIGVHRGNPAWYAVILPYFVALIVAAVVGVLVWAIASGEISHLPLPWNHQQQLSQSASPSKTSENKKSVKSDEDKSSEGEDDDDNKSEENKSDRKDAGDSKDNSANDSKTQTSLDKSVAVKVLNATKISGHAAAGADKLKQAGYANVTAGNPTGKVPGESVVWYKDDSQKAAAEDIAKTLGISAVENEKQIVSPIVVVLCK
ncbi:MULTISPECIES: LytR C-terminal domain-containing protein [Gardnerella]|uniref:LytR C-terminal domain-containing protein n=1 Tax=Gardnerella TaxID=2701 RepID=UPI0007E42A08|nr:LytR C-terminal domain-containing protein [Gardnerella sp. 26-12]PMC51110.1 transcription initiation factor IIF [Gardnerella vaginalis]PMC53830.1 transcription initiation factor IIF [Gardnerella vaginalis]